MKIKLITCAFLILTFSAGAYADTTSAQTAPEEPAEKIFMQVGALEKKDGEKYILRKKSGELEFYLDENTLMYSTENAGPADLKEGQLVLVKGARNANAMLASTVQVYNSWDIYSSTKDNQTDAGQNLLSGFLKGTVVRPKSEADEYEYLQNKYLTQKMQNDAALEQEAEAQGDKVTVEPKIDYIRPFYIKTADKKVYMVLCDGSTRFTLTDKKTKEDMKPGDRLKLYFNKRITIRYKSYPVKIVIEKAK
ncbi:MAG: hypothetical protein CVV21_02105 [Candidatus Goldiibacteriota bacterium HGW-Goldbacteria-1]|jgi:hypothetical protein|nr:MAG: hypothetical protein CVV21_02105 [Candidatus Goldiibacteriota bacterium HGW-Goldbacteria-1]